VPFDEVTAKKSISRLQKKLDQARADLQKVNYSGNLPGGTGTKATPIGVELIDNTLQIITSM